MQKAFSDVLRKVKQMIIDEERWKIPLDRCQSEDEKQLGRIIRLTHPKEMTTALRHAVRVAREAGKCEAARPHRELDWLTKSPEFCGVVELLERRVAEEKYASGTEANQRREITLHDHQQSALFESIFSCKVAQNQQAEGRGDDQQRKPIDALTLGTITSLYMSLGQRGMNIDDLMWGYLDISKFSNYHVWEGVKPFYLTVTSKCKGDKEGGTKHLASVMHHRDPMRCPIAAIGLYFAYQFFGPAKDALPTLSDWLDTMHHRPLIRNQSGAAAHVADYNSKLKQDLALIGADSRFTFHCCRDLRIAEAGEDPAMARDAIMSGVGHSNGSHSTSYRSFNAAFVLQGAGYQPKDTQVQAAHIKLLHEYLWDQDSVGNKLVSMLYREHRPDLLRLEAEAAAECHSDAGVRMSRWLNVVRHCIMTWVVSSVAHPRKYADGLIDCEKPVKRQILASGGRSFVSHLDVLLNTPEFIQLSTAIHSRERTELSMGPAANHGATERRLSAQIAGVPSQIVPQIVQGLQPKFDDEEEHRLDRDFFQSLDHDVALFRYQSPDGTIDWKAVREARLRKEQFKKTVEGSTAAYWVPDASVVNAVPPPPPPRPAGPPNAGLASAIGQIPEPPPREAPPLNLVVGNDGEVKAAVTTKDVPTDVVKCDEKDAESGSLRAEVDSLRAELARYKLDDDPPPLTQVTGVCQMLRAYVSTVAPKERRGPDWRGKQQRGEKDAQRLKTLLSTKYAAALSWLLPHPLPDLFTLPRPLLAGTIPFFMR